MSSELDKFVDQLQDEIFNETRREFGEIAYKRWREPKFMGRMNTPDGYAKLTGTCGDTMEIFLKFENDRVVAASFMTDGCGPSVVCGSFAAELANGKSPEELIDFNGDMILDIVDGLPKDHEHCAYLSAETVKSALDDYMGKSLRR